MFKAPFSFEGRIRRLEYGISLILYIIAYTFIEELLWEVGEEIMILYIPVFWFNIAQSAKRCHDRNGSGWWQLVPFYGLWLLFGDGDEGPNQYGPNPKNPKQTEMPNTSGESAIEELEKYAKMKEAGALTEEEFKKIKEKVLSSDSDVNNENENINFE